MIDWTHLERLDSVKDSGFDWPDPFPHNIYAGDYALLTDSVAREVAAAFPPIGARHNKQKHLHSNKYSLRERLPQPIADLIVDLNSDRFIRWLERETGIIGLVSDQHLYGGGIHTSGRKGFLDVHADFMVHPMTGYQRILNLLIYLTPEWDKKWGGGLELWDKDMSHPVKHYACTFNTAVLFECSATSYHGVSAVTCPEGVLRQSLAIYYYKPWSEPRPETILTTTDYRPRPWQYGKRLRRALTGMIGPKGRRALRSFADILKS